MRGKIYKATKEKVPTEAVEVKAAVSFLQEHNRNKFDEMVELHVHLGIDPEKSDQMVRGEVTLPAGSPKEKKIAVFTDDPALAAAATKAGAVVVGGEELLAQITKDGSLDADVTVATPEMMPKIAKVARILGPKGLMPNPKTGTVTPDPAKVVTELRAGKVSFKMDNLGNIHEAIAKLSWDAEKISQNVTALLMAIRATRPTTAKGEFIRSATLKSTMSPGVKIISK